MTKATKKASANTETVIGSAAQSLRRSLTEFTNAKSEIESLADRAEQLSMTVATKEAQIDELEVKYAERERQLSLDLDLRMKEKAETVVNQVLASQQKTSITTAELSSMRNELEKLKAEFSADVAKAVNAATSNIKTAYESEKKLLEANHLASEAQNKAQIGSLEGKVSFLEEQVVMWKEQLVSERQASIERSKNTTQPTINVTGQK